MRRPGSPFFIVAAVLLTVGCVARPHWETESRIVFELDDEEILHILEGADYDYEHLEPGAFRVRLGDYGALLLVFDDTLLIHTGFAEQPSLRWVNDWNRASRFSRCYLDGDGDVNLESDLNLAGGVSERSVVEFIELFSSTVDAFVDNLAGEKTFQATL